MEEKTNITTDSHTGPRTPEPIIETTTNEHEKPNKEYEHFVISKTLAILLTIAFITMTFHFVGNGGAYVTLPQVIISFTAVVLIHCLILKTPPEYTTFKSKSTDKPKDALLEADQCGENKDNIPTLNENAKV